MVVPTTESVRRSKTKPNFKLPTSPNATTGETENAVFDALCTATSLTQTRDGHTIHLHHRCNNLNDCWVRQSSEPQPFLTLTATAHPEDYRALRYKPITPQPKTITISAMADTRCQICLASIKVIRRLGLCEDDLIPITIHMHAANNNGIKILGVIILRFSGRSPCGQIPKPTWVERPLQH